MKILCITSRVPWPLEKGDKLRIYHQLRELSIHHDIFLFALSDAPVHPDALKELGRFCKEVVIHRHSVFQWSLNLLKSLLNGLPFQVGYFTSGGAARALHRFAVRIQPDRLYCQLIRTAEYRNCFKDVPAVIDYMDVFSKGVERRIPKVAWWKRRLFRMEWKRLLYYEQAVFNRFQGHTIISSQDRNHLPVDQRESVVIVPNGVDTGYFAPVKCVKEFRLLFNGNMNYPPNIESVKFLVNEVLPLVWKERPEVNLLISGADPSPEVKALAGPRVTVTGWVDDVRESFARSEILVAPMKLSIGLQNKLLEAMAMKLPCITTPLSNNALGAIDGKEILLAETATDFAAKIIHLLDHPGEAQTIAENAHRLVKEKFSWQGSVKVLEKVVVSGL